jgi:hypothetical protein
MKRENRRNRIRRRRKRRRGKRRRSRQCGVAVGLRRVPHPRDKRCHDELVGLEWIRRPIKDDVGLAWRDSAKKRVHGNDGSQEGFVCVRFVELPFVDVTEDVRRELLDLGLDFGLAAISSIQCELIDALLAIADATLVVCQRELGRRHPQQQLGGGDQRPRDLPTLRIDVAAHEDLRAEQVLAAVRWP